MDMNQDNMIESFMSAVENTFASMLGIQVMFSEPPAQRR